MALTTTRIRQLKPGWRAQDYPDAHGLALRVLPSGRKTWTVVYRENGRRRRQRIGHWPDLGLREARAVRDRIRARNAPPEALTLAGFAEEYLAEAKTRKRSWEQDQRLLERAILPELGSRPVAAIQRRECARLLDAIRDRGAPDQARRVYTVLRRVLQVAVDRDVIDTNPAQRLGNRLPRPPSRDRVLGKAELAAWWTALIRCEAPFIARHALVFVLATGQRLGEVLAMAPGDWDPVARLWLIPDHKAKNGVAHSVPLTDWAEAILESVQPRAKRGRLFPVSGDCVRHHMRRAVATADLPRATPHDLRRTVATYLGGMGYPRTVQNRILNHKDATIGGVYDRHTYDDEKAAALAAWATEVGWLLTPVPRPAPHPGRAERRSQASGRNQAAPQTQPEPACP